MKRKTKINLLTSMICASLLCGFGCCFVGASKNNEATSNAITKKEAVNEVSYIYEQTINYYFSDSLVCSTSQTTYDVVRSITISNLKVGMRITTYDITLYNLSGSLLVTQTAYNRSGGTSRPLTYLEDFNYNYYSNNQLNPGNLYFDFAISQDTDLLNVNLRSTINNPFNNSYLINFETSINYESYTSIGTSRNNGLSYISVANLVANSRQYQQLLSEQDEIFEYILAHPELYGLYSEEQYNEAYNRGVLDGKSADIEKTGFADLLITVLEAPYYMFKNAFNFNFFGLNVASLVAFLVAIGLVIWLLSVFKGGK